MAFTPYTLTRATTFTRATPNGDATLTLQAGESCLYERSETTHSVIHRVKVTRDGYTWTAQTATPKTNAPAAPTCPVCEHNPMVRMSSGKGWRCGAPGNRWANGAWTVCDGTIFDTPKQTAAPAPVVIPPAPVAPALLPDGEWEDEDNGPTDEVIPDHFNNAPPGMNEWLATTKAPPMCDCQKRSSQSRARGAHHAMTCPMYDAPATVPALTISEQQQAAYDETARSVGNAIAAIAAKGVYATDSEERTVRELDRRRAILSGTVWTLNYYIPSEGPGSEVENPSRALRRHGFRLDGSNWIIGEAGLNHPTVQAALRQFTEWQRPEGYTGRRPQRWLYALTPDQLAAQKEVAQEQLAHALQEAHKSLINRIASAAADLEEARETLDATATQRDRDALDNAHNVRVRAAVTDACERFESCLKGAEIFDDTGSLDALFASTRDAIRTQAALVNAGLRKQRVKQVKVPATIG